MRTALCFSGELRSIDKCLPVWKEKILPKIGDFDSFYFGWEDDPQINKLNYFKDLNLKDSLITKRVSFKTSLYEIRKRPEVNVQGLLRQIYCLKMSNKLKEKYESSNDFKYDCVIRMRPDILIEPEAQFPDLSDLDLNKLHVFKHDPWFGYNDRVYFSNNKNMNILQNRLDIFNDYFLQGGITHYESFFKYTADKNNIFPQYHDFRFKLLRANGSVSFCWENDYYWSKMWDVEGNILKWKDQKYFKMT